MAPTSQWTCACCPARPVCCSGALARAWAPSPCPAWRASVVQGVQVAATLGHGLVALTTGGRTESFAMATLRAEQPGLPAACFVQMGDFLRYALDEAVAQGLPRVVLGVMVGKLTKIAQGET